MAGIFQCEVLTKHIHALGKEHQVDPNVWHDGLWHFDDVDFWGVHDNLSLQGAKELRRRMIVISIPESDLRIVHTVNHVLSDEEIELESSKLTIL